MVSKQFCLKKTPAASVGWTCGASSERASNHRPAGELKLRRADGHWLFRTDAKVQGDESGSVDGPSENRLILTSVIVVDRILIWMLNGSTWVVSRGSFHTTFSPASFAMKYRAESLPLHLFLCLSDFRNCQPVLCSSSDLSARGHLW